MPHVETVRGPVDVGALGTTLMHEHVFILNEEIRRNYPDSWDENARIRQAITKLTALTRRGGQTIADPTVLGLGRDIHRIRRIAAATTLNIIVATGLYTYSQLPFYFNHRHPGTDGIDPMTEMFVKDITTGIANTPVKAAFLKCAIDKQGMTPGVERVMRAVCQAHRQTGAPITVHTHPQSETGLLVLKVLREEGADLAKVVLGHSGDTTDLNYLATLADAGCLLGMDRFGMDMVISFEQRVDTVAALCARGYAGSMVLSHDASCDLDWYEPEPISAVAPNWHFEHIFDDVLPALRDRGVADSDLETMLVANPSRYFSAAG
jgi:phosphotriesterase-related protein